MHQNLQCSFYSKSKTFDGVKETLAGRHYVLSALENISDLKSFLVEKYDFEDFQIPKLNAAKKNKSLLSLFDNDVLRRFYMNECIEDTMFYNYVLEHGILSN